MAHLWWLNWLASATSGGSHMLSSAPHPTERTKFYDSDSVIHRDSRLNSSQKAFWFMEERKKPFSIAVLIGRKMPGNGQPE
jgi:hypothetical protein